MKRGADKVILQGFGMVLDWSFDMRLAQASL